VQEKETTMAVDERARHQLFQRLEQVLGPDEATTLMETLPPVGYADLVTKEYLDLRLDALEQRLAQRIGQETRTIVFALVAVVVSISSVALFR
jgi:hypothetical protein